MSKLTLWLTQIQGHTYKTNTDDLTSDKFR